MELLDKQARPRKGPKPTGLSWAHESSIKPPPSPPSPPPASSQHNIFPFLETKPQPFSKPSTTPASKPAASGRDPSASRPYHQFLYQVRKEARWLRDEFLYQRRLGRMDVEALAHQNIKNIWMEDKIWNPKWDELPGMTWMHEERDLERPETPEGVKETRRSCGLSPIQNRGSETFTVSPQVHCPEPSRHSEEGNTRTLHSQQPEKSVGRSLRGVQPSKVEKRRTLWKSSRRNYANSNRVCEPTSKRKPIRDRGNSKGLKIPSTLKDAAQSAPRRSARIAEMRRKRPISTNSHQRGAGGGAGK